MLITKSIQTKNLSIMKKLFLLSAILMLLAFFSQAKAQWGSSVREGDIMINAGIGFLPTVGGSDVETTVPPLSVSGGYVVSDNISIGGYIGYVANKSELSFSPPMDNKTITYGFEYSYLIIGARGSYYFVNERDYVLYGGGMLGYNAANSSSYIEDDDYEDMITNQAQDVGGFAFAGFLGAKYFFSDNVGAYLELGYGVSIASVGLSLKF